MAHNACFHQAAAAIAALLEEKERVIVAIDGRCAAGKTTLAQALSSHFGAAVIHMDEFFLQPHQRTEARLRQAGGNVDYERFLAEVLLPLRADQPVSYRPYDCHTQSLQMPIAVAATALTIVEGSYSCHDALWPHYDLHLFLDVDEAVQRQRLLQRNGAEGAARFAAVWVPLEEQYFTHTNLRRRCELYCQSV